MWFNAVGHDLIGDEEVALFSIGYCNWGRKINLWSNILHDF